MNKFLTLIFVIIMGIAVIVTAYVLSKSKLGGEAKASSEKISIIGKLDRQQPCMNETLCYRLLSQTDDQIYFINTKEFAWISVNNIDFEKLVGRNVEIMGLYIQGKTSYIIPTEIK